MLVLFDDNGLVPEMAKTSELCIYPGIGNVSDGPPAKMPACPPVMMPVVMPSPMLSTVAVPLVKMAKPPGFVA